MADPNVSKPLPASDQGDFIPGSLVRIHARALYAWPDTWRRRIGAIVAVIAFLVATAIVSSRLVGFVLFDLDLIAYVGLALTCWIGAGGALVPIPGVRPLSWIMIVQQGATLDPILVASVAALAMAIGQTSLYVTAHVGRTHVSHHGHHDRARGHHHGTDERPDPGRLRRALARARDLVARMLHTHPGPTVFVVSLVPNPLTSFASASAGAEGVAFRRFFVASTAGFIIFSGLLVLLGAGALRLFGLSAD